MRARGAVVLAAAAAATLMYATATSATPRRIAVLPLTAATSTVPYTISPLRSDLDAMTRRLRAGLATAPSLRIVPQSVVARALRAKGRDQTSPERACDEPRCARDVGSAAGADVAVYGEVTRAMAVVWGTRVYAVDVHTGAVVGDLQAGYKGDVTAMTIAERHLGACLANVIAGRPHCPSDRGY